MLRYCRKLLWIFLIPLSIVIFPNEEAHAAKTACDDTKLWIDRGIVRQAEAAASEPGAEICGVLVVKEFYPKNKLSKEKAKILIKSARNFLSSTSALYPTLLVYIIDLGVEPDQLTENFNEGHRYSRIKPVLDKFWKKQKLSLFNYINNPTGTYPSKAVNDGWDILFKVKKCIANIKNNIEGLSKLKFPITARNPEKNFKPSLAELEQARKFIEALDKNHKERCRSEKERPDIPIRK